MEFCVKRKNDWSRRILVTSLEEREKEVYVPRTQKLCSKYKLCRSADNHNESGTRNETTMMVREEHHRRHRDCLEQYQTAA